MAFSQSEYNLLLNIFRGDEDLISSISSEDITSFSKYLTRFLDGTKEGVSNLENETKRIIELLKNDKVSRKTKIFLQKAIISSYGSIAIGLAKNNFEVKLKNIGF